VTARGGPGWRSARTELVVALISVIAVSGVALAWAGTAAAVLVLTWLAVVAIVLLRTMAPADPAQPPHQDPWQDTARTSFTGFWRKRGMLDDGIASMAAYEMDLRPTLQHLLAAKLADRHGVNLYQDPAAARRLLLPVARDAELWYWLDPQRHAEPDASRRGIPLRTLAAIIDRLERL
jgi:hypothetical protein